MNFLKALTRVAVSRKLTKRRQPAPQPEAIESEWSPFGHLYQHGFRAIKGLDTRGKTLEISFEAPCQINNAAAYFFNDFAIGRYTFMRSGIFKHMSSIGRYCSLGPNLTIGEGEHPTNWLSTSNAQYFPAQFKFYPPERKLADLRQVGLSVGNNDCATGSVEIGHDVWIGAGATIRRGVKIGNGAIIAGGAFVNIDVEPYSIVGGLPARTIRKRFSDEIIEKLIALEWWRFDINDLAGVQFDRIEVAIDQISELEAGGNINETPFLTNTVQINSRGWKNFNEAQDP